MCKFLKWLILEIISCLVFYYVINYVENLNLVSSILLGCSYPLMFLLTIPLGISFLEMVGLL